jgi:putative hydrolases of HD superfamily
MHAIVQFILELDRLKQVTRKTRLLHDERFENSAEHSWQIAMLALSLLPHAAAPVDAARVVELLLVHDIGEIDTGDVMLYANTDWAAQKAAERRAVERIFGLLPDAQRERFLARWVEFDEGTTPEATFANAVDRAMPALLNLAANGQSWREYGVRYEQVVERIGPPIEAGCPALWRHMREQLDAARAQGWFGLEDTARRDS